MVFEDVRNGLTCWVVDESSIDVFLHLLFISMHCETSPLLIDSCFRIVTMVP